MPNPIPQLQAMVCMAKECDAQHNGISAQTLYDINVVLRKLGDELMHARFTEGRSGMVPPGEVNNVIGTIEDALATLLQLNK